MYIVPMIGNQPFSMRGSVQYTAVVNSFYPRKIKHSIMSFSLDGSFLILAAKLTRRQPSPQNPVVVVVLSLLLDPLLAFY